MATIDLTAHEAEVLAQFIQTRATPRSITSRGLRRDDTLDPSDAEVLAVVSLKVKIAQFDALHPTVLVPNHCANPFPTGRHNTGWQ